MAEARLRITTVGAERVRATLNGLTTQVRAQSRTTQEAARANTRAVTAGAQGEARAHAATGREERRIRDAQARHAVQVAREEVRLAESTSRSRIRIFEREERQRRRLEQRPGQRAARGGGGGGGIGAGLGAVASGAAGAAVGLYGRAAAVAGIGSLEERIAAAGRFGTTMNQLGANAGLSREQVARLQGRIVSTSDRTGIRAGEFAEGLATAGDRFGPEMVERLASHMDLLADTSVGSGASISDLIGVVGTATQAYGLSDEEIPAMIARLAASSRAGSINTREFATVGASSLANHAQRTGRRGLEAAMEGIGTMQALGTAQAGASETSTRMDALMRELTDANTQRALQRAGVNVRGADGNLRPLAEIADQIQGSRRLRDTRAVSRLGLSSEAAAGLLTLRELGGAGVREFSDVTAESGRALIDDAAGRQYDSSLFRLGREGARAENRTINDAPEIAAQLEGGVGAIQEVLDQYPLLAAAAENLTGVFTALGGALGLKAVLGGGAAAGTGAAGGGALATAGGAGGAGLVATFAPVAALGAAAFGGVAGFGYMTGKYAERAVAADEQLGANDAQAKRAIQRGDLAMLGELDARRRGQTTQDTTGARDAAARGQAATGLQVGALLGGGGPLEVRFDADSMRALQGGPVVPTGAAGTGAGGAERTSAGQGRRGPR